MPWKVQPLFNELYLKVANDEQWLFETLGPPIEHDAFFAALWHIHLKVRVAGVLRSIVCGIFRSDYMLHSVPGYIALKQVEMNTFSVAEACHAERFTGMHRHLRRVRAVGEVGTLMWSPSSLTM